MLFNCFCVSCYNLIDSYTSKFEKLIECKSSTTRFRWCFEFYEYRYLPINDDENTCHFLVSIDKFFLHEGGNMKHNRSWIE
jgi:hypothetical protein